MTGSHVRPAPIGRSGAPAQARSLMERRAPILLGRTPIHNRTLREEVTRGWPKIWVPRSPVSPGEDQSVAPRSRDHRDECAPLRDPGAGRRTAPASMSELGAQICQVAPNSRRSGAVLQQRNPFDFLARARTWSPDAVDAVPLAARRSCQLASQACSISGSLVTTRFNSGMPTTVRRMWPTSKPWATSSSSARC